MNRQSSQEVQVKKFRKTSRKYKLHNIRGQSSPNSPQTAANNVNEWELQAKKQAEELAKKEAEIAANIVDLAIIPEQFSASPNNAI